MAPSQDIPLRTLLELIEEFRTIDPQISSQAISTFLVTALDEGITVAAVAKRLGLSISSASNNIAILSGRHRRGAQGAGPGYGLVEHRKDSEDFRRTKLYLTTEGAQLAERVAGLRPSN
jgi:DNA-binding MarR family transcriptional regulator